MASNQIEMRRNGIEMALNNSSAQKSWTAAMHSHWTGCLTRFRLYHLPAARRNLKTSYFFLMQELLQSGYNYRLFASSTWATRVTWKPSPSTSLDSRIIMKDLSSISFTACSTRYISLLLQAHITTCLSSCR